jgi:hypothetical protein
MLLECSDPFHIILELGYPPVIRLLPIRRRVRDERCGIVLGYLIAHKCALLLDKLRRRHIGVFIIRVIQHHYFISEGVRPELFHTSDRGLVLGLDAFEHEVQDLSFRLAGFGALGHEGLKPFLLWRKGVLLKVRSVLIHLL